MEAFDTAAILRKMRATCVHSAERMTDHFKGLGWAVAVRSSGPGRDTLVLQYANAGDLTRHAAYADGSLVSGLKGLVFVAMVSIDGDGTSRTCQVR
jgi:hypothetical protein